MKRTVKSRHDGRPRAGSRAPASAPPRPKRRVATHWLVAILALGFAASTWPGCGRTVCDKSSEYISSCLGTSTTTTTTTTTSSTSGVGGSSNQSTNTGGGTNSAASECVGEDECAANCNNAADCTEIIDYYGGTASSASASLQACLAGCYVNSTAMGASSSSVGGSGFGGNSGSGASSIGGSGNGGAGGVGGTGGAAGGGLGGAGGA